MYAEFYNLGDGPGVTVPTLQVSLCGSILRVELPRRYPDEEQWHFVPINEDQDFVMGGVAYTDFGVSDEPRQPLVPRDGWNLGLEQQ